MALCSVVLADDRQLDERLNPSFDSIAPNYADYPCVHLDKNRIALNGADWKALGEKYRAALAGDSLFSIVYLGDSHIQADFGGSVLRRRLSASHPAGRGLVVPFRLAGTNQPNDYTFDINTSYTASRLLQPLWETEMPFTGIGIKPGEQSFTLSLTSPAPVHTLRFHTSAGRLSMQDSVAGNFFIDSDGLSCLRLNDNASEFSIGLIGSDDAVVGGIELLSDSTGVLLHSIGNNGATYSHYTLPPRFGAELAHLHPDLIIVALGTNEAFGKVTTDALRNNVVTLIDTIRSHNPSARILIVGPAECYRRTRRGRRRSVQTVNTKVATVARTIRLFAEDENIPYYNHFAIAGNAPSQRKAGILGRDGVHYTVDGYRLWGNLLADAILEALKP